MQTLKDFLTLFYLGFSAVAILWMIGDLYCFSRVAAMVISRGLYAEYRAHPNRTRLGSGYRLWKHFKTLR